MPERLECVGGPLDGTAMTKVPGRFAWATPYRTSFDRHTILFMPAPVMRLPGHVSARPAVGAALYELGHLVTGGMGYLYAGHRRVRCDHCGAIHTMAEGGSERPPCHLCGHRA